MSTVIEDFPAMKEAVAAMRALLEGASEDLVFESMLVARELITNALRYGGGRAYFTYDVEKGYLRIAVRSENGFRPPKCPAPPWMPRAGGDSSSSTPSPKREITTKSSEYASSSAFTNRHEKTDPSLRLGSVSFGWGYCPARS